VISVSPVPDGPFGQDLPYGPASPRVNGVVHELGASAAASIHEFCTDVDDAWTSPGSRASGPPQPPIANISIRGSADEVASVRRSE
jgi:hypothetical protein